MIQQPDERLIKDFIVHSLAEDVGSGDHTSLACISSGSQQKARLLVKDSGVIAGVSLAEKILQHVDPNAAITVYLPDGAEVGEGDVAFEVDGNTRALLMAERTLLNVMQRMSAIATVSRSFAEEVEDLPVKILDTRKTTPLLRFIEKWAVRIGGCYNYRDGLYDWIMIKDNHVDACGGISQAISKVREYLIKNSLDLGITVEVRNLNELEEAIQCGGINRIMFDNFELPLLCEGVEIVNKRFETEASGGVNLRTVRKIAETGVDFISVGALTHSAGSLDLSFKFFA